eukprot:1185914-Prorocentrum_minimum.AAC.1
MQPSTSGYINAAPLAVPSIPIQLVTAGLTVETMPNSHSLPSSAINSSWSTPAQTPSHSPPISPGSKPVGQKMLFTPPVPPVPPVNSVQSVQSLDSN